MIAPELHLCFCAQIMARFRRVWPKSGVTVVIALSFSSSASMWKSCSELQVR